VHVHCSVAPRTKKLKTTKTGATRRVPIEPTLLPLLEAMREESGGKGRLVKAATWDMAEILRADLKEAGVTRADIEADDATRRPLDFHDLRHTYGTWRAIRGDDLTKISRAMGHSTTAMTEKYVNEAEAFDMIGEVFPVLRGIAPNRPGAIESSGSSQKQAIFVAPPGVEPGRPFEPRILNPLRLPFRQGAVDESERSS